MKIDDTERLIRMGKEMDRMINDVRKVQGADADAKPGDCAYARMHWTFPGGGVHVFVVSDERLADLFEAAARTAFEVSTATPPSTIS